MLRFANCCKVAQWLIWVTEYGRRLLGLLRLPPAFFMGKMLLIILNIIKLLYIAQFPKINTRWVTEVTAVTAVTRATEADCAAYSGG